MEIFRKLIEESETNNNSTESKEDSNSNDGPSQTVVTIILIILIVGFGFFIYNWYRCIKKRPQHLDDDLEDLCIIEMGKNSDNKIR